MGFFFLLKILTALLCLLFASLSSFFPVYFLSFVPFFLWRPISILAHEFLSEVLFCSQVQLAPMAGNCGRRACLESPSSNSFHGRHSPGNWRSCVRTRLPAGGVLLVAEQPHTIAARHRELDNHSNPSAPKRLDESEVDRRVFQLGKSEIDAAAWNVWGQYQYWEKFTNTAAKHGSRVKLTTKPKSKMQKIKGGDGNYWLVVSGPARRWGFETLGRYEFGCWTLVPNSVWHIRLVRVRARVRVRVWRGRGGGAGGGQGVGEVLAWRGVCQV